MIRFNFENNKDECEGVITRLSRQLDAMRLASKVRQSPAALRRYVLSRLPEPSKLHILEHQDEEGNERHEGQ